MFILWQILAICLIIKLVYCIKLAKHIKFLLSHSCPTVVIFCYQLLSVASVIVDAYSLDVRICDFSPAAVLETYERKDTHFVSIEYE